MKVTKLQLINLLNNYMEGVKNIIYSNGKYAYDQFVNMKITDYQVWNNCVNTCCKYQQEYDQIKTILDDILVNYNDNQTWIFDTSDLCCMIKNFITFYEIKCHANYSWCVNWDEAIKEF